ncbi:MAG: hypothetical protein ACXWJX_20225 [Limisphaerales bacterium]
MKSQSKFITCAAAILSIAALSAVPALAQKKTAKACQEEWQANKAANQANKITEKAYVAKCQAEGATAKPAAAPPAAAPATTAAKPAAGKPKDARQAEYARERACGQDWKAEKAAGKIPAGTKWPQYWSECNKRKKAAGM